MRRGGRSCWALGKPSGPPPYARPTGPLVTQILASMDAEVQNRSRADVGTAILLRGQSAFSTENYTTKNHLETEMIFPGTRGTYEGVPN